MGDNSSTPVTASPSDSSPALRSAPPSPRSAVGEVVSALAAGAVSVWCAKLAAPLLVSSCDDRRYLWGLGALVIIAAPTSVGPLVQLARRVLGK